MPASRNGPKPSIEYDMRIRHLAWLRRQIRLLAPSRTYPAGVKMTWTLGGTGHWDVRREDYPKLRRYQSQMARYLRCAGNFDSSVEWCERTLDADDYNHDLVAKAEVAAIRERLSAFLGRRLRTRKECDADTADGRRRDFPYLVPTPDGLVECWTRAEVERAKRRPGSSTAGTGRTDVRQKREGHAAGSAVKSPTLCRLSAERPMPKAGSQIFLGKSGHCPIMRLGWLVFGSGSIICSHTTRARLTPIGEEGTCGRFAT